MARAQALAETLERLVAEQLAPDLRSAAHARRTHPVAALRAGSGRGVFGRRRGVRAERGELLLGARALLRRELELREHGGKLVR